MAKVLAQFAEPVSTPGGVRYRAQACGAPTPFGLWEGWIEFIPLGRGTPVRSPRETTQPNRVDAEYWATGLTAIYLEGALDRALKPRIVKTVPTGRPLFETPAADLTKVERPAVSHQAVLNPFSLYEKGETLLRQELGALSAWHLINILVAYRLTDQTETALKRVSVAGLIDRIVVGVRDQALLR